jgi:hypothetical protein
MKGGMFGKRTDPRARRLGIFLSTFRVGLGIGTLLATRPALRALGFKETNESSEVLARLAGGRDLALGALTLLARNDPAAFRSLILGAAALDAADAFSLGLSIPNPETRPAGIGGVVSAGGAALAGLWAWRRL